MKKCTSKLIGKLLDCIFQGHWQKSFREDMEPLSGGILEEGRTMWVEQWGSWRLSYTDGKICW